MHKEILSIFSPKGEISGIPFFVNYIIIRLFATIINCIGLYISFNDLNTIPAFRILGFILFILNLFTIVVLIFNYKRRLLQITGNLIISIILAILLSAVLDIFILTIFFRPILMILEIVIIPLLLAVLPPKNSDKKEYWSTFFNRTKKFFKNPITIFVIIMLFIDISLIKYSEYRVNKISSAIPNETMEELVINPLSSYSGKTKEEILNIRKNYIQTSIFKSDNYEPNEEVFGQMEDRKPWWGIDYITCSNKNQSPNINGNGLSEESRFLNNPNVPVGVQMSKCFVNSKEMSEFCADKSLLFIPQKISYNKKQKLIIINYKGSKHLAARMNKKFLEFYLVGLNARDLGYNWVLANQPQNIRFLPQNLDTPTLTEKPYKFKDFIHVGNACKVEGGCNNSSPHQPELMFSIKNLPAEMTLSLWKQKPVYKKQPADLYVKIIFN